MINRHCYSTALTILLMAMIATSLRAADVNNSAAAYMRMGVGARVIAMGEAGSTVSRDVASSYWNPAGLVHMKDYELGTTYNFSLGLDRSHSYIGIGKNYAFGALAFSWINAGVANIEGYDESGQPTGIFSDEEHCFALSYAYNLNRVSLGLSPKFYLSQIDAETETGYGVDLGVRYDLNQYLELGLMARDLYGKLGEVTLPYQIAAGLAVYPLAGMTLAADVKLEQDENPTYALGAEYWTAIGRDPEGGSQLASEALNEENAWTDILADVQTGLRLGFGDNRLSAGTGIRFRNFQLDYVFRLNNHEIFNDDHILSLILRF